MSIDGYVSVKEAVSALEAFRGCFFPHSTAVRIIDNLSCDDVGKIVRAKWIRECKNRLKCGNCNKGRNTDVERYWNYCPNCGAKMDKEDEE